MTDIPFQFHRDDFGILDVVSAAEKLLHKFGTSFADRHRAERAVTGMTVAAQYHLSATCKFFTHERVYYRNVCRDVHAAVLFRRGQSENVVVLVYRAADCAKRIMTVRQNVRERKPFQPACFRTLNNADVRDVVRRDCVKSYVQIIAAVRAVRRVRRQYRIRHSALERFRNFLIGENAADFPQAFEFSVAIICAGSFYVNQCSSP